MKNISLKEMLEEIIECILNKKNIKNYFYKTEYEPNKPEYFLITEVDLMRGRYKTLNDDFSEFEWEIEKSNIYVLEEENQC